MATEKLSVVLELVSGQYKREAKEAAQATGQIGNAAKTASGQMGTFQGAVSKGVTAFKGFAGAAAGAAILKFGADSVKAASNLEESMNAVNVVFGTAASTITAFGETAAMSAGLAQSEFQQMATTLGSSLINAGLSVDEAAKKTIELTQRATDMASVFNTTVPEALGAVQAALRGESDPIEKFGVSLGAAAVDAEAAALGFKKVAGQFDGSAKSAARMSLIMQQTNRVAGDFANTSDGLANKTKQLSATFTDLQAKVGGFLVPALASVASEAVDATVVIGGLLGVIDKASEAISGNAEAQSSASVELDKYNSLLDILIPGLTASLQPWSELNTMLEENAVSSIKAIDKGNELVEAHDSWTVAAAEFAALGLGPTIKMLDNQAASHRNAAREADKQRVAMINLFNAQADLLDPIGNVLRLQKESAEAQERLTELQEDAETPVRDLAIAVIEAEQAQLRLNSAGAALTADQVQAYAQILITEFGHTEAQALAVLETLNLLDGWHGTASFTMQMNTVASGSGGGGNINSLFDEIGFDRGGIVPGPRGSQQLILAHGGETILPTHKGSVTNNRTGGTIVVASPSNNLPMDLQYAALLANHATFGNF